MNHFALAKSVFTLSLLFSLILPAKTAIAETTLNYRVLETQTQDSRIFTQGFTQVDDTFYFSSGLYGKSFLKKINPALPDQAQTLSLPKNIFAEGSTVLDGQLYLITWREQRAFVFDAATLKPLRQMKYKGEGWGLTHDGTHLIMSDGGTDITFRDKQNFDIKRRIRVHNAWRKYKHINELEYAENAIWANVWQTSLILKIDPISGKVLALANLNALVKKHSKKPQHNVLNGIAYDPSRKAFWVTGKQWSARYLIRFEEDS